MARRSRLLIAASAAAALALAACDDAGTGATADATTTNDATADVSDAADTEDVAVEPLVFCDGPTAFAYAPDAGRFDAYPDDFWSREDALTRSGRRIDIPDTAAFLADVPPLFAPAYADLNALDGWGTNAGIVISFDAAVAAPPSGADASLASDVMQLWALPDDGAPKRIAYEVIVVDAGRTWIVNPMVPLAPQTRHGLVVTDLLADADGAPCVRPSAALVSVLDGTATDPRLAALEDGWAALAAAAGIRADAVSGGVVFTTQSTWDAALEARDAIAAAPPTWKTRPTCTEAGTLLRCKGTFTARDFRVEGDLSGALPTATYDLPVSIWLPTERTGALPGLMFGHGLGGDVGQAGGLARNVADYGLVTIAVAAPRHGDHPTRVGNQQTAVLDFFGVDQASFTFKSFQFRENMRQAAFDKLQVIALLVGDPDVDGDGEDDLDTDRIGYWGASLGAIMGPDLLALSGDVRAGALTVGGARMATFISDSASFGQFRDILAALFDGEDAFLKSIPIAQTLIDAGDPANLAARVLRDRLDDADPPHVLSQMVIGDDVVPNTTSRHLARALGLTQLAPVIQPVGLLPVQETAPLTANLEGGVTAGYFQFDRVTMSETGSPRAATHNNIFSGREGLSQVFGFVGTWLTGTPVVSNPYADLGTPEL